MSDCDFTIVLHKAAQHTISFYAFLFRLQVFICKNPKVEFRSRDRTLHGKKKKKYVCVFTRLRRSETGRRITQETVKKKKLAVFHETNADRRKKGAGRVYPNERQSL